LRLELGDEPLRAHIDVTQMEAALLNLAVNARDAMVDGGTLTISARTTTADEPEGLAAGSIRLAVQDTGVGMSPEVRERVFEPFFTTKDVGRGSGLGLSQVYGFVRQSEGHVRIFSEMGAGSRFEILLPSSSGPVEVTAPPAAHKDLVGGHERVLVAEDDPAVLKLTVELLEGLGYSVVSATTAREALAMLREDAEIDLLFSDVVMPGGMNGIALANAAEAERPNLKILLTSGFVGDKALLESAKHPILDKPYTASALTARLRELLESSRRAPARRRQSRSLAKSGQRA
jgi:CheY-like chemotaxis protein